MAYDPQPFHIDEVAAAESHFGGLIASGWQVAAVWMKLNVAHQRSLADEARAGGRPSAEVGPSPGFRNMVWARPVRPGDSLAYWTTVTDKKASASRPGWGIVAIRNEAFDDQSGAKAFSFRRSGVRCNDLVLSEPAIRGAAECRSRPARNRRRSVKQSKDQRRTSITLREPGSTMTRCLLTTA